MLDRRGFLGRCLSAIAAAHVADYAGFLPPPAGVAPPMQIYDVNAGGLGPGGYLVPDEFVRGEFARLIGEREDRALFLGGYGDNNRGRP